MYKPSSLNFNTPIGIQHRTTIDVNGALDVSYQDADQALDFCSWKSKGGTESTVSGTLMVEDTAEVTMWYRPDINEQDRLLLNGDTNFAYDVINVEDIEKRHMWMILKVKRAVIA